MSSRTPVHASLAKSGQAWLGLMGRRARFILVVVLVGVVASLTRYGFDVVTGWVTSVVYLGRSARIIEAVSASPWPMRVILPAAGIVIAVLIARLLRTSGPTGVPDIMEVVALGGRPMSLRNSLSRTLSALATIAFGGSVGREGPIIHFASSVSGQIGIAAGLSDERRRILIGCGTAAGLASAYGTPLSATLFVMEVIAGGFAAELLLPCLLASVSASLVLWATGASQLGLYQTRIFAIQNPAEIGIQALLGAALGVVAALFSEMHHWLPRWLRVLRLPPLPLALVGGLGVGALVAFLPHVAGNGYFGIVDMLSGALPWTMLFTLAAAKLVASHLTIGAGGAGGLFTPTLFIGAALGAFFGHFAETLVPGASPKEAYAILGMAAMLAGTMRAPLLAVVMLVEMTRDVMIIPSLMVAVTFAVVAARLLKRESLYAEELRRRGIPWEGAIEQRVLRALHVRDIMRTDVPRVASNLPLASVLDTFSQTGSIYVYVCDVLGKFTGVIDVREMAG
ncbi:MAG: chloride channel protein, partial [Planctomycetota bacterium]